MYFNLAIRIGFFCFLLFNDLMSASAEIREPELDFKLPAIANVDCETENKDICLSYPLVSLEDYRGKLVYVEFWNAYCLPCRDSFPKLNKLRNEFGKQGFEVIGISLDLNPKDALRFLEKLNVSFPILSDPSGLSATGNGVEALPAGFLIDVNGEVVRSVKAFEIEEIHDILRSVLVLQIPPGFAGED